MHCTPQPALSLSHQPKTYALHHHAYQIPRYTCVLNIRRPMHTHASMPVYNKLHHFHCERARSFIASECEVSLRACSCVFETSVQAYPKVQIRSSTLTVKLCSRSVAWSARSETVLSQRSFEHARSEAWRVLELDHTRSFAATIVEASTHLSELKLRYARSFYFSGRKTGRRSWLV